MGHNEGQAAFRGRVDHRRARDQREPRGAHRGEARPSHARPARRPDPWADLEIEEDETRALADLQVGETARFVRVSDADPAMLRYLGGRGIALGDELEVLDRQPFDGPLTVVFGGVEHVLGGGLAQAMRVRAR